MRMFCNILMTCLFLCIAPVTFSQTTPSQPMPLPSPNPLPKPWADEFMGYLFSELGHQWNQAGDRFTSTLFAALTDRQLFSTDLLGGNLSLNIKRNIYDNRDILDTWTVVDIFNVPLSYNLPIADWVELDSGPISIGLGLTFDMSALNIRQVRPHDIVLETKVTELKEEIQQQVQNIDNEETSDEDILIAQDEGVIPWSKLSPLVMARYSKLLNLLTHPLRLPLTPKKALKMHKGEISSWLASGTVQIGASVGWSIINPTGLSNTHWGAGLSTYINGRYQFSVHKEKDDQVLLKMTRVQNKGRNIVIGNAEIKKEIFNGFLVSEKKYGTITASIIPFQVLLNTNAAKQFDIAYRFDLTKIEARKAYAKAVMGRTALAHELSQVEGSGVTWAFQREMTSRSLSRSHQTLLTVVFQRASHNSMTLSEATISTPDEERQVFTGMTSHTRGHRTFWGILEGKRYSFGTTFDDQAQTSRKDEGLIIEAQFNDNHTNAREMHELMNEVEEGIQKPGLFERPAIYDPSTLCQTHETDCRPTLLKYGRSSFYYKIFLNKKLLDILKKTSTSEMWKNLEYAFGVKEGHWSSKGKRWMSALWRLPIAVTNIPLNILDLHVKEGSKLILAQQLMRRFKDWQKINDPKEQAFDLAAFFRAQNYSRELIRLVRQALKGQKIPYYVSAHAPELFGSLSTSSDEAPPTPGQDPTTEIIDFDRMGPRTTYDPEAKLNQFGVEVLNKNEIQIRFELPVESHALYWRVDKIRGWLGGKKLIRLVTSTSHLPSGMNVISLKRNESNGEFQQLADHLFANKEVRLMVALAIESNHWGAIQSKDIVLR